jgi:hypothetical protein
MKIFNTEGLEWRAAFRRAALFVVIWLLSIYVLSTAFPESFGLGLDSSAGIVTLLVNTVIFFFFFAVLTAFAERSKKRARARHSARLRAQRKGKPDAGTTAGSGVAEDGEAELDSLKGRHNPNTSRKKTARRRRR